MKLLVNSGHFQLTSRYCIDNVLSGGTGGDQMWPPISFMGITGVGITPMRLLDSGDFLEISVNDITG